jgi:hypothetical protein
MVLTLSRQTEHRSIPLRLPLWHSLVLYRRQALDEESGGHQTERRSNVPSAEIATPAACII